MNPKDRKNMILDVAEKLFYEKGYDQTSTAEIIKKSDIARGTLYYYFSSKEDILDAVIERKSEEVFFNAKKIALDKSKRADIRLIDTLISLNSNGRQEEKELDQVHSTQNALMRKKINDYIVKYATPFFTEIVKDGIEQKIFDTKYPKECVEMILIYVNVAFDYMAQNSDEEEMMIKFQAFFYNIHKLLGAKEGSLDFGRILE
ncbi:TetR family transcriptional regulator [Peptoniphilus sp. ING2-D1G]|nr:TetR family transcriptional regulator [Peptoniphilus sp. ING2-D1G]